MDTGNANNERSNSNNEHGIPFDINVSAMRQILGISTALTETASVASDRVGRAVRRVELQVCTSFFYILYSFVKNFHVHQLETLKDQKFFFDALERNGLRGAYDNDVIVVKNSLEDLRSYPDDDERCSFALDNIIGVVDHIDVATGSKQYNMIVLILIIIWKHAS